MTFIKTEKQSWPWSEICFFVPVLQHALSFIVSEVEMRNSCFPKAKSIQVVFVNRTSLLVLEIKARICVATT